MPCRPARVDRVAGDADVGSAALHLADQLASRPPLALPSARRAIDAAWTATPDDAVAVAIPEQLRCLQSSDSGEARRALIEGRDLVRLRR